MHFSQIALLGVTQSSIFIEDGTGATVGEVHQRWHMWRRKYDLYLGQRQFATIDGGLLAWEFVLRDQNGGAFCLTCALSWRRIPANDIFSLLIVLFHKATLDCL